MFLPLLHLAAQGPATDYTGTRLVHSCQALVRLYDEPKQSGDVTEELWRASECKGYLSGFVDASAYRRGNAMFCLGPATTEAVAKVYLHYMGEHPKMLDEVRSAGVFLSLIEAYPCPTK